MGRGHINLLHDLSLFAGLRALCNFPLNEDQPYVSVQFERQIWTCHAASYIHIMCES